MTIFFGRTTFRLVNCLTKAQYHSLLLVCSTSARFLAEGIVNVSQTVSLLESLGARIVFLDINVDTRTAMGRAFMQIAAVFAELERARIRERIQTALDLKRYCNAVQHVPPDLSSEKKVERFLTDLTTINGVAASTQIHRNDHALLARRSLSVPSPLDRLGSANPDPDPLSLFNIPGPQSGASYRPRRSAPPTVFHLRRELSQSGSYLQPIARTGDESIERGHQEDADQQPRE
jgi:hypothetical protein